MNTRGGDEPPANGGEFLLQLLRKPSSSTAPSPSSQPPPQSLSQDPAVAAIGPTIPALAPRPGAFQPNGLDFPYQHSWHQSPPPPFAPRHHFQQSPSRNPNPNLTPDLSSSPGVLGYVPHQLHLQSNRFPMGDDARKFGPYGDNYRGGAVHRPEQGLVFGSLSRDVRQNVAGDVLHHDSYGRNAIRNLFPEEGLGMDKRPNGFPLNAIDIKYNAIGKSAGLTVFEQERSADINNWREEANNGSFRAVAAPPGFSKNVRDREFGYGRRASDRDVDKGKASCDSYKNDRLRKHLDAPSGPPAGSSLQLSSGFDTGESMMETRLDFGERGKDLRFGGRDMVNNDLSKTDIDDLEDQIVDSLVLEDESSEKSDKKKSVRDKDYRSDKRGQWIMSQKMRNIKRHMLCRGDINKLNSPFLAVFESLIPADEEKVKQKQLLMLLEKIIMKEWPGARLYLYGSCANSFGFSKSDIDVCLTMEPGNIGKAEVVLKLAEILQSDNLQNVQALTRARVPVVKLMDPVTGISCDICINNILAVVNTKLLQDYARIDVRLRQLALIVKHWAKSRGVNQTYQGTLSSYAYVIMCIHFLQQRRPAILPCLQRMEITYFAKPEDVECAYFDQVDKLQNFGSRNCESIAQLVWAFFHYWAYCHDYANDVISVRMGCTLSKRAKDWTRRVGNDRHLICVEDPFEVSHDLGRVVDKYSIRVLREEFERAAEILQYDPNPTITLFEPYVPQ